MALILLGKTQCALCSAVLEAGDDLVSTSHFIADPKDPLWRYSDAAMHRRCFLSWPQRAAFVEKFNATVAVHVWGNGMCHRMRPDGTIVAERAVPFQGS